MTQHTVGLMTDEAFLEHLGPPDHPECPARLEACAEALADAGLTGRFEAVSARPVTDEEARRVHTSAYLTDLARCRDQSGYLDPDTFHSPGSHEAAVLAAGGGVELTHRVLDDRLGAGLALVRPPGHHAERRGPRGFCMINNVAVAAAAARALDRRVAIVDFDVHHGNGTQDIFYEEPGVLFLSVHRHGDGFFPGSGAEKETGRGAGDGATRNFPLRAGADTARYLEVFRDGIEPALNNYSPDLLLVSAGFDAHERDPVGGMQLDDGGYREIALRLADRAHALCDGRWVVFLEGGYDLQGLSRGVETLAATLLDR